MTDIQKLIAKDLLSIKAVFFRPNEPFTWASGIKSPVYCDNRLTLTAPKVRTDVESALAETIKREYPEVEVYFGASVAPQRSQLPYRQGFALQGFVAHPPNRVGGYVAQP